MKPSLHEDTKGSVCPSLAHALHSHALSSLERPSRARGGKGLPLGHVPACQADLEVQWPGTVADPVNEFLMLRQQLQGRGIWWQS